MGWDVYRFADVVDAVRRRASKPGPKLRPRVSSVLCSQMRASRASRRPCGFLTVRVVPRSRSSGAPRLLIGRVQCFFCLDVVLPSQSLIAHHQAKKTIKKQKKTQTHKRAQRKQESSPRSGEEASLQRGVQGPKV